MISPQSDTIDHATLALLVADGAVQGTRIIGQSGGWGVLIESGNLARVLAAKRGAMRNFARFETLVAYLKKLGIMQFVVDATQYAPVADKAQPRADVAQRMRQAHEAAGHAQWFRSQMAQAVKEADAPDAQWFEHTDEKRDMAEQRAQLLARIAGKNA